MNFKKSIYKLFHPAWGEVVMLHRVVVERSKLYDNRLMEISPEDLERTIIAYKDKGYLLATLDDMAQYIELQRRPNKKFVCFTLDDGYSDNFEYAYKIFKKHNCPFAVYVSTDFPEYKALLWWYSLETLLLENERIELADGTCFECRSMEEKNKAFRALRLKIFDVKTSDMRYYLTWLFGHYDLNFERLVEKNSLSWSQIKILADEPLCTIGSHTVTHAALDCIDTSQTLAELAESKKIIERQIGKPVVHLAYPYGRYTEQVVRQVSQIGYRTAVLANGGYVRRGMSVFKIPRIFVK